MPLRLDIKKKLAQISERVKSVDLHPSEPWILASLYSGRVCIWNYKSQTMVKSFEVTELPVRSSKFIARKQWVVAGADDMYIHVYNYKTMDKVKVFEAHTDYIRCVAIHPTLPYVISSSDDMLIKLWDWEKGWMCTQIFEGHSHYVMQVTFNPKDTNTFASASVDRTIKIWNLGSPDPNFTLEAHSKGVNCVEYFTGGDKPYLITGSDDQTAKVWDYQTKSCVQTLEGHSHNVSAISFHPEFPIIITGSEDGTIRIWHATTYRLGNTLNYGFERVWAVACMKGSRRIVIGYDGGTVMIKIGQEVPIASMESSGKIIWSKHNKLQTVNIKSVGADVKVTDGERLPLAVQELGTCDFYPQSLKHSPDGRFVVVWGNGVYIIYTALAWRNRSFGSALEIAWSLDGEYCVRESTSSIKIFSKTFQEKKRIRPIFSAERIFGGTLLAMCSNDFICFYDWAECRLIHRIDVIVKNVYWADSGDLVAIASGTSFYILKYNRDTISSYFDSGKPTDNQGVEDAFELLHETNERVKTGLWVGDCFIYINSTRTINYCVAGKVTTMFHLDRPMYLLGYLASHSRVYLLDKQFNVIGYTLLLNVIENKTLVLASQILPSIPNELHISVARSMPFIPHGTVLVGTILLDSIMVGGDSRTSSGKKISNDYEIHYGWNRHPFMRYAKEDAKKVRLVGHLLVGMSGHPSHCRLMVSLLEKKLYRLEAQGKPKPMVLQCVLFLLMCSGKENLSERELHFSLLVAGYDGKVPDMYHVTPTTYYRLGSDGDDKICLGTGGPYVKKFIDGAGGIPKNLPPQYVADRVYDAIRHSFVENSDNCGGMVRLYSMTATDVKCVKYVLEEQVSEHGVIINTGYDANEGEFHRNTDWETDEDE